MADFWKQYYRKTRLEDCNFSWRAREVLPELSTQQRAGIIITSLVKDVGLTFFLGVDRRYGEITDFGGKIQATENVFQAALREFNEESYFLFSGLISEENLLESPIVYDPTVAIFLVNFQYDRDFISRISQISTMAFIHSTRGEILTLIAVRPEAIFNREFGYRIFGLITPHLEIAINNLS